MADYTQQITDLYQQNLGRAPDEAGLQFWTDAANQGMGMDVIGQQLIGSQEGQAYLQNNPLNSGIVSGTQPATDTQQPAQPPAYQPVTTLDTYGQGIDTTGLSDVQANIAKQYGAYLGRPATAEELQYWDQVYQQGIQQWLQAHPYATEWDAAFFANRELANNIAQSPEAQQFALQQLQALNPGIDVASMTQQQGLNYAPDGVDTGVAFRNPGDIDFANFTTQDLPFGVGYAGNAISQNSLEGTLEDLYAYYFGRAPNASELDWYKDINQSQPWTVDSLINFVTGSPEFQVRAQGGVSAPTTMEWMNNPSLMADDRALRLLQNTGGALPDVEGYNYEFDKDYASELFDRRLSGFERLGPENDAYKYILPELYRTLQEHENPELTSILGRGWTGIVSGINKLGWTPDEWERESIQNRLNNLATQNPERWQLIQQYVNDNAAFKDTYGLSNAFVPPEGVQVADGMTGVQGQFKERADAGQEQQAATAQMTDEEINALLAQYGVVDPAYLATLSQDEADKYLSNMYSTLDPASLKITPESGTAEAYMPERIEGGPTGRVERVTPSHAVFSPELSGWTTEGDPYAPEGAAYVSQLTPAFDPSYEGGVYGHYVGYYDAEGNLLDTAFKKDERSGGFLSDNLEWIGPLLVGGAMALGGGLAATAAAQGSGVGADVAAAEAASTAGATGAVSTAGNLFSGITSGLGEFGNILQAGTSAIQSQLFGWMPTALQPIATNTLINTVMNGGDFGAALKSSLITAGTNFMGGTFANALKDVQGLDLIGGPKAVGRIAAQALTNAVQGGDFSKLGISAASQLVGQAVAKQTGNPMVGRIVAQTVSGMAQGASIEQLVVGMGSQEIARQITGRTLAPGLAQQVATAWLAKNIQQAGAGLLKQ